MEIFNETWTQGLLALLLGVGGVCLSALWTLRWGYLKGFEWQVRKGLTWVYLPKQWTTASHWYRCLDYAQFAGVLVIWFAMGWWFHHDPRIPFWATGLSFAAVVGVGMVFLRNQISKLRFKQIENLYYLTLDEEMKRKGTITAHGEMESKALAVYALQRRLHHADCSGTYLKELQNGATNHQQENA